MKSNIEGRIHLPAITNNGFIWIDIQKPTRHDIDLMVKEFGFHELNIEDSVSKNQLPKVDRYPDYIFMVLHFPIVQKERENYDVPRPSQLSFCASDHYLVTIHQDEVAPLVEIFELCRTNYKK